MSLLTMGKRKAAVLPVPVWAEAIISCPFKIRGMTCSCTGVAFSYPDASIPSRRLSSNPNSLNVKFLLFRVKVRTFRPNLLSRIGFWQNKRLIMTAEHQRLAVNATKKIPLEQWGPYLSERQWGTVREDYSEYGSAWQYFPYDQSHCRTYFWGEDGLAGISDFFQNLCFAVALWNGKDEILKERLFGLGNKEGNHGEDVKELYYYLDNLPTHYYMEYLYKYPQQA